MLEDVLSLSVNSPYQPAERYPPSDDLDSLFRSKHLILQRKLEVWTMMLRERLSLHASQLERIERDRSDLTGLIQSVAREANYMLRKRSETNDLYKLLFTLQTEQRDKEVQCWENVFDLLKEFLLAWEAYEQGKARTGLLTDVRG